MWTFYILYSPSIRKYYIGFTGKDVLQRLRRHNTNYRGFTGKVNDWQIVHSEIYSDKESVCLRKREVKKWKSRKMIERLISFTQLGS